MQRRPTRRPTSALSTFRTANLGDTAPAVQQLAPEVKQLLLGHGGCHRDNKSIVPRLRSAKPTISPIRKCAPLASPSKPSQQALSHGDRRIRDRRLSRGRAQQAHERLVLHGRGSVDVVRWDSEVAGINIHDGEVAGILGAETGAFLHSCTPRRAYVTLVQTAPAAKPPAPSVPRMLRRSRALLSREGPVNIRGEAPEFHANASRILGASRGGRRAGKSRSPAQSPDRCAKCRSHDTSVVRFPCARRVSLCGTCTEEFHRRLQSKLLASALRGAPASVTASPGGGTARVDASAPEAAAAGAVSPRASPSSRSGAAEAAGEAAVPAEGRAETWKETVSQTASGQHGLTEGMGVLLARRRQAGIGHLRVCTSPAKAVSPHPPKRKGRFAARLWTKVGLFAPWSRSFASPRRGFARFRVALAPPAAAPRSRSSKGRFLGAGE